MWVELPSGGLLNLQTCGSISSLGNEDKTALIFYINNSKQTIVERFKSVKEKDDFYNKIKSFVFTNQPPEDTTNWFHEFQKNQFQKNDIELIKKMLPHSQYVSLLIGHQECNHCFNGEFLKEILK